MKGGNGRGVRLGKLNVGGRNVEGDAMLRRVVVQPMRCREQSGNQDGK